MPSIFGESSLLDVFMKLKSPIEIMDNVSSIKENEDNVDDTSKITVTNDTVLENNLEYIKKLQDEIEGLKCLLKTTSCLFESQPIADITYFDNDLSRKFRTSIENFINTKFCAATVNDKVESKDEAKKPMPLARSIYFKDYVINSFGQPSNLEISHNTFWEIPRYDIDNEKTIGENDKEIFSGSSTKKRMKVTCFNCGGDHSIANCPDEKDQARINVNKNNFLSSTPSSGKDVSKRYHQEENKFHELKPGVLSDKLKEALGMGVNDLPPYIYQMRLFGYPPGHLQQAKISKKEMIMFGTNGEEINGQHLEDGELSNEEIEQAYDQTKIIQYPGFNVHASPNVLDDHLRIRMPAMQPYHAINFMIQHLNKNTSNEERIICKRKADNEISTSNSAKKRRLDDDDEDTHVIDMEIEDNSDCEKDLSPRHGVVPFTPPLPPLESPQSPPPLPDSPSNGSSPKNSLSTKLNSTLLSSTERFIGSPKHIPDYPESPSAITTIASSPFIANIPTSPMRMGTVDDINKSDGNYTIDAHDSTAYIVIDDDNDVTATEDEDYIINIDDDVLDVETPEDVESKIQMDSLQMFGVTKRFDNDTTEQTLLLKEKESPCKDKDLISFETPIASDQSSSLKFGLGTPLVPLSSSFQTFDSLPSLEKFSEGMVEIVISEETQIGSFHKIQQVLLNRRKK